MNTPIRLYPGDPMPAGPYVDDDWFRFYGPNPGTEDGTTHMEVHELDCLGARCAYRPDQRCPWHPPLCRCSDGVCQLPPLEDIDAAFATVVRAALAAGALPAPIFPAQPA